ncbi:hypothetical protein GCM10023100_17610 [Actinocorallia cavernae]|uniref:Uncharacterized protein n=2 Tax=Actinomycetes TaxID=1760 RepID=A0ABP5XZR0_9ACTN
MQGSDRTTRRIGSGRWVGLGPVDGACIGEPIGLPDLTVLAGGPGRAGRGLGRRGALGLVGGASAGRARTADRACAAAGSEAGRFGGARARDLMELLGLPVPVGRARIGGACSRRRIEAGSVDRVRVGEPIQPTDPTVPLGRTPARPPAGLPRH